MVLSYKLLILACKEHSAMYSHLTAFEELAKCLVYWGRRALGTALEILLDKLCLLL
jgi:hypothetical protein